MCVRVHVSMCKCVHVSVCLYVEARGGETDVGGFLYYFCTCGLKTRSLAEPGLIA